MRLLIAFFLFSFTGLQALYYGCPALPAAAEQGLLFSKEGWFGLKVEYLGDVTLNKSLKVLRKKEGRAIESFFSYSQQGVLALNFANRFEVYGSIGEMKMRVEPKISSLIRDVFETGDRLTWGFGGRGELFTFSNATLGADFKYQLFNPHLLHSNINGVPKSLTGNEHLRYREWQLGLGLSYQTDIFIPYIGAIYNQSKGKYKDLFEKRSTLSFVSKKKFGMTVGVCITTGKIFELDLEARMINETAFSASGNFRF